MNNGPKDTSDATKSTISKAILSVESDWLERMVKAFVSCITTGNVKVQTSLSLYFVRMVSLDFFYYSSNCILLIPTVMKFVANILNKMVSRLMLLHFSLLFPDVCCSGSVECLSRIKQFIHERYDKAAWYALVWRTLFSLISTLGLGKLVSSYVSTQMLTKVSFRKCWTKIICFFTIYIVCNYTIHLSRKASFYNSTWMCWPCIIAA